MLVGSIQVDRNVRDYPPAESPPGVWHSFGATEAFDCPTVIAGVRRPGNRQPVSADDLARLGQAFENALRGSGQAEFQAHDVGLAIHDPLRELDAVAYLRFSSVYKQFESADDFETETDFLRKQRAKRLPQTARYVVGKRRTGRTTQHQSLLAAHCPCAVSVATALLMSRDHAATHGTRRHIA